MNELVLNENKKIMVKDYIQRYLDYIDVSDNTIKTYNVGLLQFMEYLRNKNILYPTREDIIAFREYLKMEHKETTINSYLIAIRNFFGWLEYEGITKNITKNVKGLKIGNEHKRNALTLDQCKLVLENAKNLREKVIFLLSTTCGLRANELVNIRLQDFKIKQYKICLYVLGKARDYKEDFVIVDREIYDIICNYVKEYDITDYLFTSTSNHNNNGQLTTKTIRLIIKDMFKRIGLDSDEYSLHSCRHTFATLAILSGKDIREVSQAMRHKSINTTTIYLHDMEKLNNQCTSSVTNAILGGV